MTDYQMLNIPDLAQWGKKFQRELLDDIDHGARIDSTRKPGFYTVQTRKYVSDPCGDWILFDDGHPLTLGDFLTQVEKDGDVALMSQLIYDACEVNNGLILDGCSCVYMCDCDTPEFSSPMDVERLYDANREEFIRLYRSVCVDDPQQFAEYVAEAMPDYMLGQVSYEWVDDMDAVFLTRKSGKRYAHRHYRSGETRVYARYVWHNPDLYNAIALLAALDFDESQLVFNEERLKQLDY